MLSGKFGTSKLLGNLLTGKEKSMRVKTYLEKLRIFDAAKLNLNLMVLIQKINYLK